MRSTLIAAAVAAVITSPLGAQTPSPAADSTCTKYKDGRIECRIIRGRVSGDSAFARAFYRMDSAMANRAALGLQLRATGTRRDTLGVFVEAVTPKGPAETAGIVEGDRIAAINGVDLRSSAADVDDPYTNGLASHRLTREVQKLTPGSRVTLRVYSGGRFRDVQVVAGKASDVMRLSNHFNFRVPGPGGMMEFNGPGFGGMMLRSPMPPQLRMFSAPKIRLRGPAGFQEMAPGAHPRVIRMKQAPPLPLRLEEGGEGVDAPEMIEIEDAQPLMIDPGEWFDDSDANFDFEPIDVETEIHPVSTETIRDLAAAAVRDSRSALRELAAAGLV